MEQAFSVQSAQIGSNILAPRYHEPAGRMATQHLIGTHDLVTLGELIREGVVKVATGDEIGKMAYGTGKIPFVRTSDISGWEIKIDPKHCVSEEIYERLRGKQDVRRGDILMVRDGTYLIGSCAIVTEYDERILYQSHLLKFRVEKPDILSPYLLLAALSSVPVQRQIKSKTFTQDIIDSLGTRYTEIVLALPKSVERRQHIEALVEKVIIDRIEARELARKAKLLVAPPLGDIDLAEFEVSAD
jgi:type I restriction enzyme M protein